MKFSLYKPTKTVKHGVTNPFRAVDDGTRDTSMSWSGNEDMYLVVDSSLVYRIPHEYSTKTLNTIIYYYLLGTFKLAPRITPQAIAHRSHYRRTHNIELFGKRLQAVAWGDTL